VQFESLTGPEKSAILILSLEPHLVQDMLSQLEDEDVERILAAVSRFDEIPASIQARVLGEFSEALGQREVAIRGGRERALRLVEKGLEEERAKQIFEKLGRDEKRVDWTLRPFGPAFIADVFAEEDPQTIAVILSQIPAERGAAVIAHLPEPVRPEVVLRLAELETVSIDIISQIEEEVAEMFTRRRSAPMRVGGTNAAAKLLNRVAKADGQTILEGVDVKDPEVADQIRKLMLTFHDLISIDDRGFQNLLREIATDDLVIALKTASEEMKEKLFSNVSSRAGDHIREEMELLGPMKLSEVEAIQRQIVDVARRLEDEGKLTIGAGGGDVALV
jgi:flagellar motor switch protein FliG